MRALDNHKCDSLILLTRLTQSLLRTLASNYKLKAGVALRQKSYPGGGGNCSRYMRIHLTSQATD